MKGKRALHNRKFHGKPYVTNRKKARELAASSGGITYGGQRPTVSHSALIDPGAILARRRRPHVDITSRDLGLYPPVAAPAEGAVNTAIRRKFLIPIGSSRIALVKGNQRL